MPAVEERVDRLEQVFAAFVEHTAEALAESREGRRAADRRMEEFSQRTDEFNRRMDEFNVRAERDRKLFNREMAQISASVGRLVEDLVIPNAERIAAQLFPDDPVSRILPRAKAYLEAESMEIDLIAPGKRNVMLIEARHRLDASDVREILDKLPQFPKFFPEYANHRIVVVAASIAMEDSLRKFLTRQKIYGLAMGDETMELVNFGEF
jgi:hypothetical protein